MENFLHWYFGSTFSVYFAIGLLLTWMFTIFIMSKRKGRPKGYLLKKWWFWLGTIAMVLHINWISYINPSYFGYGTPNYFTLIDVEDEYVVLYDTRYAYIEDEDSRHEEYIPNLRVHLIDRNKHERVYWDLIGDYYYPIIYGDFIVLKENNTYSNNSDHNAIQSLKRFDVHKRSIQTIAEEGETIMTEDGEIEVHSITFDSPYFVVKGNSGDQYMLLHNVMEFEWFEPNYVTPARSPFQLSGSSNSVDKSLLIINGEDSEREFLFANLANETDSLLLIFSENDLDKTNPKIELITINNQKLWEIDLSQLKEICGDNDIQYIHRTLIYENFVYVTSHEYLFEFDLNSAELNWYLEV